MSNFDSNSKFLEIKEIWKNVTGSKNNSNDLNDFDKFIKNDEDFEKLKDKITKIISDKIRYSSTIGSFIYQNMKPVETFVETVVNTQEVVEPDDNSQERAIFKLIAEKWPKNPQFTENKEKAWSTFLQLSNKFSLVDIATSAKFYTDFYEDPTNEMLYPHMFRTFLQNQEGIFEHWLARSKEKPDPDEIRYFEAVWKEYPIFPHKERYKKDAQAWVKRFIKPEDKFHFLVAVGSFKWERKIEANKKEIPYDEYSNYTMVFSSWAANWKMQKLGDRLTTFLGRSLIKYLEMHRIDPEGYCYNIGCFTIGHYHFKNCKKPEEIVKSIMEDRNNDPKLPQERKVPQKILDESIQKIINESYEYALKYIESMLS